MRPLACLLLLSLVWACDSTRSEVPDVGGGPDAADVPDARVSYVSDDPFLPYHQLEPVGPDHSFIVDESGDECWSFTFPDHQKAVHNSRAVASRWQSSGYVQV